jgi:integrase
VKDQYRSYSLASHLTREALTRTLGSLLVVLLLAGCGTWKHPTATREQLLRDDYECKRENRARPWWWATFPSATPTAKEEAALLPLCGQDLRDLMEAGLLTGMREGELIRLTRARVDLENRLLNFPPTKKGRKWLMPVDERLYYLLCRRCAGLSPTDLVFSLDSRP